MHEAIKRGRKNGTSANKLNPNKLGKKEPGVSYDTGGIPNNSHFM